MMIFIRERVQQLLHVAVIFSPLILLKFAVADCVVTIENVRVVKTVVTLP